MSLRSIPQFPSAWASFVLSHVAFLRRVLTNPLEHGDAIVQHDSDVQILASVSVALHTA